MNYKKMIKNIPSKVKVDKKTFFEILWSEELIDKNGDELHGKTEVDTATKQIILHRNQTAKNTIYTLIHEYFHAINFEHEIGLTEDQVLLLEDCYPQLRELILTLEGIKKNDK